MSSTCFLQTLICHHKHIPFVIFLTEATLKCLSVSSVQKPWLPVWVQARPLPSPLRHGLLAPPSLQPRPAAPFLCHHIGLGRPQRTPLTSPASSFQASSGGMPCPTPSRLPAWSEPIDSVSVLIQPVVHPPRGQDSLEGSRLIPGSCGFGGPQEAAPA